MCSKQQGKNNPSKKYKFQFFTGEWDDEKCWRFLVCDLKKQLKSSSDRLFWKNVKQSDDCATEETTQERNRRRYEQTFPVVVYVSKTKTDEKKWKLSSLEITLQFELN